MQTAVRENNIELDNPGNDVIESTVAGRNPENVYIERPLPYSPDSRPVNGNYTPDDEDDEVEEDDLILGDEEATGDEEEFDVELADDLDEDDIDEDDLVIDSDDDFEDDEEDDDL
jgi:hypothetical protein